ncbi:MAG: Hsp20/alpha crystallin family protein [Gammaproteobacteria bacterium]|nr:Hsp20/alpha crystallin family protein [Gammaproteobacteria bacterium]
MNAEKKEVEKVKSGTVTTPFDEMEQMLDRYFSQGWMRPFRMDWPEFAHLKPPFEGKTPSVDIIERDAEIVVRAELPGVDKDDIDISVTERSVSIKGSSSHEEKEEKGDYYRSEISRGSFARSLPLPAEVEESKAKASFKDGILELTLPKKSKSKRHKISID